MDFPKGLALKFLIVILLSMLSISILPTSWFVLGLITDPRLVWLEFELSFRVKVIISVIGGGIVGGILGIEIQNYKSLLMSEEEIKKANAGWKWMLFNDVFVLEIILFFYTSFILYILILQEDQENIQIELLRLVDITYPLWLIVGLWIGDSVRKRVGLKKPEL